MGKERGKVNPERVRQRFSREFKLEAVRLLEQGGKPSRAAGRVCNMMNPLRTTRGRENWGCDAEYQG